MLREPAKAIHPAGLLIRTRFDVQVALEAHARTLEEDRGHCAPRDGALHVRTAAPPEPPALDFAAKRLHRPEVRVLDRNDIGMAQEAERAVRAARAWDDRDTVAARRRALH